jgi:nucleotide-binding universal stress UspA family protein
MTRMSRVIAGVSGSPGCLPAVRYAAEMARAYQVPLIPVLAWLPPGGELAERSNPSPILRDLWADAASRRLRAVLEIAFGGAPPDVVTEARVIRGDPGRSLVQLACEPGDLLVIGAGRRRLISRALHAGVSRYCLAHAVCPVVAVPPSPLDRELGRLGVRSWAIRHRSLRAADIAPPPPATTP